MPRPVVPSRASSTRRVTFELQGIRPFSVTAPRTRRSSSGVGDDVPIASRADVAARIDGARAHRTDRTPGSHERPRALDEGRGLRARDGEAGGGGLLRGVLRTPL